MNRTDLSKLMIELALPLGYQHKAELFWKAGETLAMIVHFQSSRWGNGLYVNFGVTPHCMIVKRTPPGAGYWGITLRPTSWRGPYFEQFCRCESDHEDEISPKQMTEPLRWLLKWMEKHLSDDAKVRRAVLNPESWLWKRTRPTAMLKDWANHELRPASHYFDHTPYYR